MLIVFSGLPGTGKTTLARELAARVGAVYVRIDTIEQAIRDSGALGAHEVGRSGYFVANGLALGNLQLGATVIVDCVNPVAESRNAWADVALRAGTRLLDIQIICSDRREHQRRVECRPIDIPGLSRPSWSAVLNHDYEPWAQAPWTLDTARLSPAHAVEMISDRLRTMGADISEG